MARRLLATSDPMSSMTMAIAGCARAGVGARGRVAHVVPSEMPACGVLRRGPAKVSATKSVIGQLCASASKPPGISAPPRFGSPINAVSPPTPRASAKTIQNAIPAPRKLCAAILTFFLLRVGLSRNIGNVLPLRRRLSTGVVANRTTRNKGRFCLIRRLPL